MNTINSDESTVSLSFPNHITNVASNNLNIDIKAIVLGYMVVNSVAIFIKKQKRLNARVIN